MRWEGFLFESPEVGLLLGRCFSVGCQVGKTTQKSLFFRLCYRNTIDSCYNKSNTNTTLLIHTEPDLKHVTGIYLTSIVRYVH